MVLPPRGCRTDRLRRGNPPRRLRKGRAQVSNGKDIREAVEAELSFDPLVDATNIAVKNMSGEVALDGTVPSYPQYREAATAGLIRRPGGSDA